MSDYCRGIRPSGNKTGILTNKRLGSFDVAKPSLFLDACVLAEARSLPALS